MTKSVTIVTGSSSEIGKATAIRLSRDFSAVVLAARSAAELREVAEQVGANGAEPLAIDLDLMALTAAETVVSQTLAKFGRIDALVEHSRRRAGNRFVRDDRPAVERRHGA
jgi:3-oxoacyl-[acyl-carrier protein] reductase